ncbi:hypothetical protein CMUS01_11298 [Colletotrichum musicola]|uniref:Uncharacterized protein n=1 Tax=Colletotrichum musicola TaxID=2175873 RepID=A0A8H6N749_9PEZI|nr:hypothetical protein CMUS01_11298 [Colletotrichum musicola]
MGYYRTSTTSSRVLFLKRSMAGGEWQGKPRTRTGEPSEFRKPPALGINRYKYLNLQRTIDNLLGGGDSANTQMPRWVTCHSL